MAEESKVANTDSIRLDIRAAVVAFFRNFDDAPVKGHVARFQKIAGLRLFSLVLLFVTLIAVHLPVLFISGSDTNTYNDIFRSLSMVCAFFLNLYAIVILNRTLTAFKVLQTYFMINFFCLVFEMSMFHLGTHHDVVIFFGIIGIIIRTIQIFLAFRMVWSALRAGASSEELYTRYMDQAYVDDMHRGVNTVTAKVGSYEPQTQQEASLIASLLATSSKSATLDTEDRRANSPAAALMQEDPNEVSAITLAQSVCDFSDAATQKWKLWNCIHHIRKTLFHRDEFGHRVTVVLIIILTLLTIGNFTFEFVKIFMNQTPLFDDDLNEKYKDEKITKAYMPQRTHNTWKVHIVVVDGLRYDHTEDGASAIGDYMNSAAFKPYSMRFKAHAQLPSFSVPNWMSILTGNIPETHGVTGNLGNDETTFDHIFNQAKNYGIHAGMTGTPWWKNLVFSTLPPLDGDGTVDASFVPPGTPAYPKGTSDPADWQRQAVALKAARRSTLNTPFSPVDNKTVNLYELFLTHFSDVDKQGHEYGIDTKWNTDDSYMRAIANKTEAIKQLVDVIDTNTVLIVTSDHGHVNRGGHGGIPMVLREIPVVFYVKGMNMSDNGGVPKAKYFPEDKMPRSEKSGAYQNLDICATVCALLGIPSPRQSIGIMIEEAVEKLVPESVRLIHYYDLFNAKLGVFKEYREMLQLGVFSNIANKLESDNANQLLESWNVTNASSDKTAMDYADGIRDIRPEYTWMRDARLNYMYLRNLICSILLIIPWMMLMLFIFDTATVVNIPALIDAKSPCSSLNRSACVKALLTVFFYLVISIVVFLVAYFPVTGYTVWDSTLTHTPSVATQYLVTTIIAPIIVFVLLTKAFLGNTIAWRTPQIFMEMRFKIKKVDVARVGVFLNNVFEDIKTFCFTTSRYKAHMYPEAYLYIYFLAFWTASATFILLLVACPFTWIVPVVFSTEHVTEFNLQHRFRVITVLMMLVPLQVGTTLLLYFRPNLSADTLLHWDNLFVQAHLEHDLFELKEKANEVGADPNGAKPSARPTEEVARVPSPQVESVNEEDLGEADGEKKQAPAGQSEKKASDADQQQPAEETEPQEVERRIKFLLDCMSAILEPQYRVTSAELFLAAFYDGEGGNRNASPGVATNNYLGGSMQPPAEDE